MQQDKSKNPKCPSAVRSLYENSYAFKKALNSIKLWNIFPNTIGILTELSVFKTAQEEYLGKVSDLNIELRGRQYSLNTITLLLN